MSSHQQTQSSQKLPTTKEQLIAMLKQQLQKVQDDISEMQATLQNQRVKRKQLTHELQLKQKKIQQLLDNQNRTLGDKVNQGLYNTLEAANKIRADAEAEKRTLAEDNVVLNQKITHRDSKVLQDRKLIQLNKKKVSALQQKKIDLQRKQQNLIQKKQDMKKKLQMMKNQNQRIQKQQFQLRNHLQNLKKLRLYLNKNLQGGLKNLHSLNNGNPNINQTKKIKPNKDDDSFWN